MDLLQKKLTTILYSLGWDGNLPDNWATMDDKLGWMLDQISSLLTEEQGKLGLHFKLVDELPETGEDDYFYLVPSKNASGQDIYEEYLWIESKFEKLGSTDIKIDNYYTKDEIDGKTDALTAKDQELSDNIAKITDAVNSYIEETDTHLDTLDDTTSSLQSSITSLSNKEAGDVLGIKQSIAKEIEDRTDADTTLTENLDSEIANREKGDSDTLATSKEYADEKVSSEETRATTAEQDLYDRITKEVNAGHAWAVGELNTEATSRKTADDTLQSNIDAEATLRSSKDEALEKLIGENKTSIESNLAKITEVEGKIPTAISQLTNDSGYITKDVDNMVNYYSSSTIDEKLATKLDADKLPTKLSSFENDKNFINNTVNDLENYYIKTEVDSKLADKLDSVSASETYETKDSASASYKELKEKDSSQDSEITNLKAKDTELKSEIDGKQPKSDDTLETTSKEIVGAINEINTAISSEATRATNAETVLDKTINDEISRAQNAEDTNAKAIAAEASRAEREEELLQTNIESESTRAQNQEKLLQSNINGVEDSLSAKISTNTSSITELKTSISDLTSKHTTDITTLTSSISDETTRATNKESELETSISTETSERESKDADLQAQLDTLTLSSDCKDVVSNKAALDSYDKTTLTDNDIIKVLSDESNEDKISYYRYSATDSTYTLIGAMGPFPTISEVDTKIEAEKTRAEGEEATLNTAITAEINNRMTGDETTLTSAKEYADDKLKNYVDLSTAQTIGGSKTFSENITAPNIIQTVQAPLYDTYKSSCGITPRWFSSEGGDSTFFLIDLSSNLSFLDMFIGGNNSLPTKKWCLYYTSDGTLKYAINAVEMELRIHQHRRGNGWCDVFITDHRTGKMVNDSVGYGYVIIYSSDNLIFEGYVGTSESFYSTTKPSWFDSSALSENYNSKMITKEEFDSSAATKTELEATKKELAAVEEEFATAKSDLTTALATKTSLKSEYFLLENPTATPTDAQKTTISHALSLVNEKFKKLVSLQCAFGSDSNMSTLYWGTTNVSVTPSFLSLAGGFTSTTFYNSKVYMFSATTDAISFITSDGKDCIASLENGCCLLKITYEE